MALKERLIENIGAVGATMAITGAAAIVGLEIKERIQAPLVQEQKQPSPVESALAASGVLFLGVGAGAVAFSAAKLACEETNGIT